MELGVTLILGALTGWLAAVFVETDVSIGILASAPVGALGAFAGVGVAGALGLHGESALGWMVVVVTAILSAGWLVGTLRAALGLMTPPGAWR